MGQLFEPKHNFLGQISNKKSIGQIMFVKNFVDIFRKFLGNFVDILRKFCRYFQKNLSIFSKKFVDIFVPTPVLFFPFIVLENL